MQVEAGGCIRIVPKPDRRRRPQGPFSDAPRHAGAQSATGADEHLPTVRPESRAEIVATLVVGTVSLGLIVLAALLSLG